jgi:hypothetical protein
MRCWDLFRREAMKRFNVVIPKENGGIEVYPMKQ